MGTTTNNNRRPAGDRPTTPPTSPLPVAPQQGARSAGATGSAPIIPLNIIDAPTQRFYAFGVYVALLAWKFYDWAGLVEENSESFWLFLKWIAIDCVFLFGLPELRIPWLELSQPFVVVAFFGHAVFDWMLMFNVGLPWQAWILGFVKVFYDRELAISEHNVKLSNILHNSSLIMGRQVINILPEG
jgi:nucleoporin POM152